MTYNVMLKAPEADPFKEIKVKNTGVKFYPPQISSGMVMIPLISEEVKSSLPKFVDNSIIDKEVLFIDDTGEYNMLSIQSNQDFDYLILPASHLVGGKQNRGIDKIRLLTDNNKFVVDAHCFEPNRSSGGRRFIQISETPIDVVFTTMTTKGTGASWGSIETYTSLIKTRETALLNFLKSTDKDRTHLALNFETKLNQTGVVSMFGSEYMSIELFPNKKIFNQYRPSIYKGKFASLIWKNLKQDTIPNVNPEMITSTLEVFLDKLDEKMSNRNAEHQKEGKYDVYSVRTYNDNFISDCVLNSSEQVVYMFGMQKF